MSVSCRGLLLLSGSLLGCRLLWSRGLSGGLRDAARLGLGQNCGLVDDSRGSRCLGGISWCSTANDTRQVAHLLRRGGLLGSSLLSGRGLLLLGLLLSRRLLLRSSLLGRRLLLLGLLCLLLGRLLLRSGRLLGCRGLRGLLCELGAARRTY